MVGRASDPGSDGNAQPYPFTDLADPGRRRGSFEIGIDVPIEELLVLVIREAALRVMLIGQLTLVGESIVSFDGAVDDIVFDRAARPPAILITDDAALGASFEHFAVGDRWRGLIQLADDRGYPVRGAKIARVDRHDAFAHVSETLTTWRQARRATPAAADLTPSG
ncbi:MAG: hypothetical protein WC804_16565 [Sphingomonas sp.]|jgi:hypothetical protein|uniref:hypothetical protein n=1 Tax=Sphingomonas sp. TaxID=28214 RepID=UPI00356946AF